MSKIPTAEEVLIGYNDNDSWTNTGDAIDAMIEFAKLHVKVALKEALESIPCLGSSTDIATYDEVKEAVLNVYPDDLIQ